MKSFLWIGWVGCEIAPEDQPQVEQMLLEKNSCIPVYLPEKIADEHYNGFSNGVLWPLCHYLAADVGYEENVWTSYCEANRIFADVVAKHWKPDDFIWVHDYHLLLFPEIFRKRIPTSKIGFFLHIPFPSSEIFRLLPCRREILLGMLSSDLIGFHTYDYARHFIKACTRVVGLETAPNGVYYQERFIPTGVFPVGIDPDKFDQLLTTPKVQARIAELQEKFKGKKILVGVDRLDYIKGMPHKLLAIERLFQKYPEWRGKLVLIQIAVPSRCDVEKYQQLKREVDQLVGRINGAYGSLGDSPIHYLFQSVDSTELTVLYSIADAALITSIRDGMNLVCQEYAVCKSPPNSEQAKTDGGVLILSEFCGAAQSLSGAVMVNPWNTADLADAINMALTLTPQERQDRLRGVIRHIYSHTAAHWGKAFLKEFQRAVTNSEKITRVLPIPVDDVTKAFMESKRRLLMFAYDGTLVPYSSLPSICRPPSSLLKCLAKLSDNKENEVYLLSGRDRKTLSTWFAGLNIGLSAEYGYFLKKPNSKEWTELAQDVDLSWKDTIRPIFQYYTRRTPGSSVEEAEMHITWHYRNADPVFGGIQARELLTYLDNLPVDIVFGDHALAVRSHSVNPTATVKKVISTAFEQSEQKEEGEERGGGGLDFLMIVGDSHLNPQDLPSLGNGRVYTCALGRKVAKEKYYFTDSQQVCALLETLARASDSRAGGASV
eukprot:Phypoly_transcript_03675.p1 GENE.Phypoly_transcript_03675~~Phypoly_transcript_03675.p1  ORF type:complete len:768 (+),score=94.00 Phypoly_transcript_03675:155-2305(+)